MFCPDFFFHEQIVFEIQKLINMNDFEKHYKIDKHGNYVCVCYWQNLEYIKED
jgi:hypothetical protein